MQKIILHVDSILIIDKPVDWTSHDVVARVRRWLRIKRVGHTGTLDPFATGVLVVLVGQATRLAQFLANAEKEYEAVVRFGFATDTGDLTGTPRAASDVNGNSCATWSDEEIEAVLRAFRGEIEQTPPMYSAKKVQGQKLYELARRGLEIERAPVPVRIHEIEAIRRGESLLQHNADGTCDLRARVVCSAGTYIRVLAEAIGERLGIGAHLAGLRRTRAGAFRIEQAITLDKLQATTEANELAKIFIPLEAGLSAMPFLHLSERYAQAVRHGAPIPIGEALKLNDGEYLALKDTSGILIAVAVYDAARKQIRPRVVLAEGGEKSS